MVARETVCLHRLGGTRREEVRFGRWMANPKVTVDRIVAGWADLTGAACADRHVLALQDTTEVGFTGAADRRRGLGPVKKGNVYGVLVHAMLAVDAATQACLGLVGGQVWNRPGVVTIRHERRPLQQRESVRWLTTAEQAKPVLRRAKMVTEVSDRESDLFAKWASVAGSNFHLLGRASVDRALAGGGTLFGAAAGFAEAARGTVALPARGPSRPAREATVSLRFGAVELCRPKQKHDRDLPQTLRLRLVEVREAAPPEGVEPLHWRLLTTHAVDHAQAAWQIVAWYKARWTIEQLFRVMKSQGLQLEDSQLGDAGRLLKLTAVAAKAACRIIQLVQARDGTDRQPASNAFTAAEMQTLAALNPTLEGGTARQQNPHQLRSLAWASWIIARLGGWNCYYKPPGPITMRRGMEHFHAINRGWHLRPTAQQCV